MGGFLDIHTHKSAATLENISIQSFSLTETIHFPENKPISVGIHPWHGKLEGLPKHLKQLETLALRNNVKLIGECGLDKLKGEKIEDQITILDAQLELAQLIQKPVILHCVKAFGELIELKKKLQPTVPLIIHGFNKNHHLAEQLMSQGFYLSFGAALLRSEKVASAFAKTEQPFFLETDDTEIPIEMIYQKAAEIEKISMDELKDVIFANWKKFNII